MKRYIASVILLLFLPVISSADERDADKIKTCFESYKKSIIDQNGDDFIKCLDKKSFWYYDGLVEDTLSLPADRFEKLSMIDRWYIMRLSVTVPLGVLFKMHGKELLAYSVSNAWFDEDVIKPLSIDNIKINKNKAVAEVYSENRKQDVKFVFVKEGGQWKFVILSHLYMLNNSLKKEQLRSGKNEDEYLKSVLKPFVGNRLDDFVYEPLFKR